MTKINSMYSAFIKKQQLIQKKNKINEIVKTEQLVKEEIDTSKSGKTFTA